MRMFDHLKWVNQTVTHQTMRKEWSCYSSFRWFIFNQDLPGGGGDSVWFLVVAFVMVMKFIQDQVSLSVLQNCAWDKQGYSIVCAHTAWRYSTVFQSAVDTLQDVCFCRKPQTLFRVSATCGNIQSHCEPVETISRNIDTGKKDTTLSFHWNSAEKILHTLWSLLNWPILRLWKKLLSF